MSLSDWRRNGATLWKRVCGVWVVERSGPEGLFVVSGSSGPVGWFRRLASALGFADGMASGEMMPSRGRVPIRGGRVIKRDLSGRGRRPKGKV